MLEETSIEEKKAEAQNLLEQLKSAVNQPRLYVYQFFEDMRNDIDIQSCIALNETNKEQIHEYQAKLIDKVQEFESLCLQKINADSASDFQMTIEQTESYLNGQVVAQAELDRFKELLSNELLKVEKALFQNKCMFFVKASEKDDEIDDEEVTVRDDDESGSDDNVNENLTKKDNLFGGLLITVEDCFMRRKVFHKE
jgi:hypothetical protein